LKAIISKLKAWDGQEEWKCTEFLDGNSLTQVAWMEAADNFIYRYRPPDARTRCR
jgi:hypothetical protein